MKNMNKQLIENYFATVSGSSEVPLTDYFGDDIVWTLPPAHPFGGPFHGVDAVMEMMGMGGGFFRFETIAIKVHVIVAEGDNVVAHFQLNAKTSNDDDYENQYLFRFQCRDNKIVGVWEFLDTYYQSKMGMFD